MRNRKQKSIVRFCSFLRDPRKTVQNAQKFKEFQRFQCRPLQKKTGHVESNDRSQVHAEEEGKRETVSDLVKAWNNRSAEVLDV